MAKPARNISIENTITKVLPAYNDKAPFSGPKFIEIADVVRDPESQSRLTPTDATAVRAIGVKMDNGEDMPPIVVWERDGSYILVDGNHRLLGATRAKKTAVAAYVVNCDGNTQARILSAAFNAGQGRNLTPVEIRKAVIDARRSLNLSDSAIAALYGFNRQTVAKVVKAATATERASRLGVAVEGLSQTHLEALSAIILDQPFVETLKLVAASAMNTTDVKRFVRELAQSTSEDAQVKHIAEERAARGQDIAQIAVGRRANGSPLAELRALVGAVSRVRGQYPNVNDYVFKDQGSLAAWVPQIDEMVKFLTDVNGLNLAAYYAMPQNVDVTA